MTKILIQAIWETLLMVGIATFVGILLGLPIGILLFATDKNGLFHNKWINTIMGFIVNAVRSIPYIILVVAIIPLTRLIVGTSFGTLAASVPLSIAAVMLYCRMVEEAIRQIPKGLIEAAQSMGASKKQIITKVLIPEALPQLISSLTLVVISLIGFSAMAGTVGGGGLGAVGINYGYNRYNLTVMIEVVLILIVGVQLVQTFGEWLAKRFRK